VLGLSQAHLVAPLICGAELPMPRATRLAKRAALRASTDELARYLPSCASSCSPDIVTTPSYSLVVNIDALEVHVLATGL